MCGEPREASCMCVRVSVEDLWMYPGPTSRRTAHRYTDMVAVHLISMGLAKVRTNKVRVADSLWVHFCYVYI